MLLNPFIGSVGVGSGGGPTYFFEERFEGTGYDNSNANGWAAAGTGTVDPDYTGTGTVEGSQSLRLAGSAQQPRIVSGAFTSDVGEMWGFLRLRVNTLPSALRGFIHVRDSTDATIWSIQFTGTNALSVKNGTQTSTATTDIVSTGTNYYVWFHFIKGTGSNGISNVAYSSSSTEVTGGTSFTAMANGTSTTNAHSLIVGMSGSNATIELIIDQLLISTTGTIGDNPA